MKPRWYQQEACNAVWASLKSGRGNPLIDLPTGSGKSLVLAELARVAVEQYAGRVVILAHRKELLRQNAAKVEALTGASLGVYSAGLGSREVEQDVIVAGIQSIYARASELGRRHMIIIDEAHLTPRGDDGMYRQFIAELGAVNPGLKVVGLTATPYRLDCGQLWGEGELFSHVCYRAPLRQLIEEGYLCNLVTKPSETTYDTSGLRMRQGEFIRREVEDLFGDGQKIAQACREIVDKSAGRKSILVFCSGVDHAEKVRSELAGLTGERVDCVTGETPSLLRASTLEAFARGEFRFCVNVDVLTTGFDSPRIDCVAVMRATQSAGLFAQCVGRGLRIHPDKVDALVIDFGGNLKRFGPLDAQDYGLVKKDGKGTGEAPTKECPGCQAEVAAGVRRCDCGFLFPEPEIRHEAVADTESQILSEPEVFAVEEIFLARNNGKNGKQDTLRVEYICKREDGDLEEHICEWVCLEHPVGYARHKAELWWKKRSLAPVPSSIDDAISLWDRGALADCSRIRAQKQGRWWRILGYDLGELPEEWNEEAAAFDLEIPF